ncbi:MAG: sulfatase [Luminiphilus sp.]|jgi:arylsulfatase A-like enzyme
MKFYILTVLCLLPLPAGAELPNILLLMAEDMSPRVGAFNDPVAVTPNLDRLAKEGVIYTNVFATAGVCAPSRAAMILGIPQVSSGAQHMRTASRPAGAYFAIPPQDVKAFPELLRSRGYYTYTDSKLDYQFSHVRAGSGPFTIWDAENVTSRGWANRSEDQPFFGWQNFFVTHESNLFGKTPESLRYFFFWLYQLWIGRNTTEIVKPEDVVLPPYYPDTKTIRADIAQHYNNIAEMDRQVGEALTALEQDGLLDSTIVIWMTDHGDGLPRAKRELYDSGINVPVIVRWPDKFTPPNIKPGSKDNRLISTLDLAPTILSLASVELPEYLHGSSFMTSNREYVFASRDRIDYIPDRQRAVRDKRFKYIRSWHPDLVQGHRLAFRDNINMVREMRELFYAGQLSEKQASWFQAVGSERLFNVITDPHEVENLAGEVTYSAELARLRKVLDEKLVELGDSAASTETDLVRSFNTSGERLVTEVPSSDISDCLLFLSPTTPGSSVAWRRLKEHWKLYAEPIDICNLGAVEIRAVRYGWLASEIKRIELDL